MTDVIALVDTPRLRHGYDPTDAVLDLKNKFGRGKVADHFFVLSVAYLRRKDSEKKPVRFRRANLRQVRGTSANVVHDGEPELGPLPLLRNSQTKGLLVIPLTSAFADVSTGLTAVASSSRRRPSQPLRVGS